MAVTVHSIQVSITINTIVDTKVNIFLRVRNFTDFRTLVAIRKGKLVISSTIDLNVDVTCQSSYIRSAALNLHIYRIHIYFYSSCTFLVLKTDFLVALDKGNDLAIIERMFVFSYLHWVRHHKIIK